MIRTQVIENVLPSPESPPGMTASKSSKSSSFQSLHSDDGSVLADVGHFEEIGLDDDTVTLKSPSEGSLRSSYQPKNPPGRTLAAGRPPSKSRPPYPSLQTNVYSNPRSTSLTALSEPPMTSRQKSLTSPASTTHLSFPRRHRSPSPNFSLAPRDPKVPARPRRGSWQTVRERKSFTDLERECDEDDGDDIPDGLFLDNVPISPRPPQERIPSRPSSVSPSPDRAPKERVRSVGNGTPATAQAQGSLRSPAWKDGPVRSPVKARAQSWNAALAELNPEAKALTEKLEEHAGELEEQYAKRPHGTRPNTWDSSRRSFDNSFDKRGRIKSTPELPPLRKTNIMIDPLPVSKEKEAVLSRTRPSWLPPKDPAEERRHLKQYQKMMAASAKADERREASRRARVEGRDNMAGNLMHFWEEDVIPRWTEAIRERRTRELWWKGIAPRSRGAVWAKAIGNELGLSGSSFQAALARAKEVAQRVDEDKGDAEDIRKAKWLREIRKDAADKTWKDLRIFEVGGPLHQDLIDVLSAYAMYRSDIGYISGSNTIAALLLLNLPNSETAFIALANALNRPLPLSFYTSDHGAQASACNLVLQTLAHNSRPLHEHFTKNVPELNISNYLGNLFTAMFTAHLAIDEAARLWDVYVFEGDGLLIRAAVAFLMSREMSLLGAKTAAEVQSILAQKNANVSSARPAGETGAEDRFMLAVREAGKA